MYTPLLLLLLLPLPPLLLLLLLLLLLPPLVDASAPDAALAALPLLLLLLLAATAAGGTSGLPGVPHTSYRRVTSFRMVDLPLPLLPTTATDSPGATRSDTPFRICMRAHLDRHVRMCA